MPADKDPETGSTPTEDAAGAGDQIQPGAQENQAQADQATGQKRGDGDQVKTFTQAEVDQIIAERLKREKEKTAKAADKARQEAEEKRLAEEQKFQALAEKRQSRVQELEVELEQTQSLETQLQAANKALAVYRDQLLEGVPEQIRELLEDKPIPEQLSWLTKYHQESRDGQAQNGRPSLPATPAPKDRQLSQEDRRRRAFQINRL